MRSLTHRLLPDYDTGAGTGLGSSGTTGYNNSTTGNTGHHGAHNAGPHTSKLANEADPRVDSDLSEYTNLSS